MVSEIPAEDINFGGADTKQCTWSPADMPRPPHLISSDGISLTIPYGN